MTKPTRKPAPSLLDHAIVASVAAMLAFNIFVLSQQLAPAPTFAAIDNATGEA